MSDSNEEPGFEHDVNELPKDRNKGSPDTLEESPETTEQDEEDANLETQRQAAEERKDGDYQ
jgi:hypothetical protein